MREIHWVSIYAVGCFAAFVLLFVGIAAVAQQNGHFYIANVLPPDDYVALRSAPSSQVGQRIGILPNGDAGGCPGAT